jgi:hypothetical protein
MSILHQECLLAPQVPYQIFLPTRFGKVVRLKSTLIFRLLSERLCFTLYDVAPHKVQSVVLLRSAPMYRTRLGSSTTNMHHKLFEMYTTNMYQQNMYLLRIFYPLPFTFC